MSKKTSILARLALVTATIIWGYSFVLMKDTLDHVPSFYLLAIRFTMATVVLSLIFMPKFRKMDIKYLLHGSIMGLFLFLAYGFQTVGLTFTTPGKNAFLTAVYCIIVPFLSWAVTRKRPTAVNIIAALLCVVGVWFVSVNSADNGGVNIGDLLTLCCGFLFACHIIAVNRFSPSRDVILLTIIQFGSSAVFSWICGLAFETFPTHFGAEAITSLLYLGVLSTAFALLLQNVGQKYTPPSSAALILSLEAVFGVVFSVLLAGEKMTLRLTLGFALIFAALIISEALPVKSKEE